MKQLKDFLIIFLVFCICIVLYLIFRNKHKDNYADNAKCGPTEQDPNICTFDTSHIGGGTIFATCYYCYGDNEGYDGYNKCCSKNNNCNDNVSQRFCIRDPIEFEIPIDHNGPVAMNTY